MLSKLCIGKIQTKPMITHAIHTFTNKRFPWSRETPPPAPSRSFLNDDTDLNKLYITGKEIIGETDSFSVLTKYFDFKILYYKCKTPTLVTKRRVGYPMNSHEAHCGRKQRNLSCSSLAKTGTKFQYLLPLLP